MPGKLDFWNITREITRPSRARSLASSLVARRLTRDDRSSNYS
ncbi:hypothetical protein trd_0855 [Thermomicrobium roseum DSM 5159]|uniref:Uncharacterized protein n=1 Tax=Thermomicrobium roseum (strain ATCC 27502 / DSM 5159 / P-2) TaxID=309801 RepID=B9KZE1_THERP|nr:hypothetical protein trd_0855 [Thermomicrobium roseum DSM 5159]